MVHGNIPQSKLEKMAEMFDCSIDYLLQRSI
nr:MAG TPA: CI repressor [Siphoviridae sp. ctDo63]DAG76715.1 MAG TPA: CI repressor [Caudoviricetes sp.]DAY78484.1 MAG TPA: CI repressor [Caudoviricetes sp.]DAZ36808.1 MAG TPA: CI repressor [Caudoviricetes sp.]